MLFSICILVIADFLLYQMIRIYPSIPVLPVHVNYLEIQLFTNCKYFFLLLQLPKGSDENWCNKLYNKLTAHGHFSKPRTSRTAFLVHHFADKVEYESEGFVQKNRDQVNDEHLNILMASQVRKAFYICIYMNSFIALRGEEMKRLFCSVNLFYFIFKLNNCFL